MDHSCFMVLLHRVNKLFSERSDIFRHDILCFRSRRGKPYLLHDKHIVLECYRHRDADASFARFQEIPVLSLAPGEDYAPAPLVQTRIPWIELCEIVHAIEVAGLQTVDLDYDAAVAFLRSE